MLAIKNLSVNIDNTNILHDMNISFELGKNYCIIGKNGSGKSSLAMTIMGNPKYEITNGEVNIKNWKSKIDLIPLNAYERAKLGVFVAFQHIPEIKGIKVFEFLKSIYEAKTWTTTSFLSFKKIITPLIEEINLDNDFLRRDINVWFSGWERRKMEILQVKLLQPKYIFLDEIDSGLDVDAFKTVAQMISDLNSANNTFIIITHIFDILNAIPVDKVFIMEKGTITQEGTQTIIKKIKKEGFN